jgi:hypothetical protein
MNSVVDDVGEAGAENGEDGECGPGTGGEVRYCSQVAARASRVYPVAAMSWAAASAVGVIPPGASLRNLMTRMGHDSG